MNKELIKKYKAEFDHWLNGGEFYVKVNDTYHHFTEFNIGDPRNWKLIEECLNSETVTEPV